MQPKLILIEGLPGSGKSTTAKLVYDSLREKNIPADIYLEGNLDHPADYDGVAFFTEHEFMQLLNGYSDFREMIIHYSDHRGEGHFVSYQKLKMAEEGKISDELMNAFYKKDIYELPLDLHIKLITESWRAFGDMAAKGSKTYIFECCFIQNPVTTGFIKHNASYGVTMNYVQGLTDAIKKLNPLLIYVDQEDIPFTFKKALKERPKEWAEFFIEYYTSQGYGLANSLKGVEGTIEILKQRTRIEKEVIEQLLIEKIFMDNSSYEHETYKARLEELLSGKFS